MAVHLSLNETSCSGRVYAVTVHGALDLEAAAELGQLLASPVAVEATSVVIDFSSVDEIDPAALDLIARSTTGVADRGQPIDVLPPPQTDVQATRARA
jgi:anti-anti-sigma regulatory factor